MTLFVRRNYIWNTQNCQGENLGTMCGKTKEKAKQLNDTKLQNKPQNHKTHRKLILPVFCLFCSFAI